MVVHKDDERMRQLGEERSWEYVIGDGEDEFGMTDCVDES
jgi:hypothetical protein